MMARYKRTVVSLLLVVVVLFASVSCAGGDINPPSRVDALSFEEKLRVFQPVQCSERLDEEILDFADAIIGGKLVVNTSYETLVDFDLDGVNSLDWDMQVAPAPNTYSLYLHSLNMLYYLSFAYAQTGEEAYIELADDFFDSWLAYMRGTGEKNAYLWYDHTVAMRTENLICYTIVKERQTGEKQNDLRVLLEEHSVWLEDEANYVFKQNHGLFEDSALVRVGYFLEEMALVDYAWERMQLQLEYAFPNQYAHIENSFGYHVVLMSYLQATERFFLGVGNPNGEVIKTYFDNAVEFLVYTYMPDNRMAAVGDTFMRPIGDGNLYQGISVIPELEYLEAQGASGENLSDTGLFLDDGYVFFREERDSENWTDATWLMFKSGFLSTTHKHQDDLSFYLYSKGYDIFIDPGMYNYMKGAVESDYLNDNIAHNGITVDNQSAPLSENLHDMAGMLEYSEADGYQFARAFNNLYNGVDIDRSVYYFDGDNFLIYDDIQSKESHSYTQVFHLHEAMEVVEASAEKAVIKIADSGWYAIIEQLIPAASVEVVRGAQADGNISVRGQKSTSLLPVETSSILFQQNGMNQEFVTMVSLVTEDAVRQDGGYSLEENLFSFAGNTISLETRTRPKVGEVTAEFSGTEMNVRQTVGTSGNTYAYYIYDVAQIAVPFDKTEYSESTEATLSLEKGVDYALIAYARGAKGDRVRELVGFVTEENDSFSFTPIPAAERRPYVTAAEVTSDGGNTYTYKLTLQAVQQLRIQWYVYRNGAGLSYHETTEPSFTYTFEEEGWYTIMYRVHDKYARIVTFDNFAGQTINP